MNPFSFLRRRFLGFAALVCLFIFSACNCAPGDIAGTYQWTQYGPVSGPQSVVVPASVAAPVFTFTTNSFDGFTGCTNQSGTFSADRDCKLEMLAQSSSISGPCVGNTDDLDANFSRLVGDVVMYKVLGNGELWLFTSDGEALVFAPTTP